ncbi:MAG: thioredoxin family protein [Candidatus Woesearchaeota archaeon]
MNIKVIGSGCPTCKKLYEKVKKINEEKKLGAEIEYITDFNELIKRGIMGSPALLINEKVVCVGMPSDEKLNKLLNNS